MIDRKIILGCIKEPMEQFHQKMMSTVGHWQPLTEASQKILAGQEVEDSKLLPVFHPIVKLLRLIMEVTKESAWDWSNPAIQDVYKDLAESEIYKMTASAIVGIVTSIIKSVKIGTLVEIGTGPGQVTASLCQEMSKSNFTVPMVISDKAPSISQIGENLRKSFPHFTINDLVWDIRQQPPRELMPNLKRPVLVFERFALYYAGYSAIDMIGPIADILIVVEDLNITGKKEASDIIYEKMGAKFFTFRKAKEYLEKHFSFIHTCDGKTIESLNIPVTTFTLAIK
jgi:hypothetical protein